jgi:formylglycine-generating enzyme required for sulfatase activity
LQEERRLKCLRGGSWLNSSRYCRSAYRNYRYDYYGNVGFRLALFL